MPDRASILNGKIVMPLGDHPNRCRLCRGALTAADRRDAYDDLPGWHRECAYLIHIKWDESDIARDAMDAMDDD